MGRKPHLSKAEQENVKKWVDEADKLDIDGNKAGLDDLYKRLSESNELTESMRDEFDRQLHRRRVSRSPALQALERGIGVLKGRRGHN